MGSDGEVEVQEQGYGLLIAATPAGAHPVLAAAEALPALAATPPAVLLGAANGSVVQLADPADPHAVLAQLRTAAGHRGPLLVYVAGQLVLDSKQRLPHLALAKSTHRSVRYTGLPWHWLGAELAGRPEGSTTLVVDLVVEEAVHRHRLFGGLDAYGCLAPTPPKRQTRAPAYSRSLAALLRASEVRPPMWRLHQMAAQEAALTGREVFIGGGPPAPAPTEHVRGEPVAPPPMAPPLSPEAPPPGAHAPDPHEAIAKAAREGRHGEAMAVAIAWETAALREGGPGSAEAVHWTEVQADLAHQAGDAVRGCELWLHAAATRLQMGQDPAADEVSGAVDRAHHCWQRLEDPRQIVDLGERLAELREWAPGRQRGALEDVRARLAQAEESLRSASAG